MESLVRPAPYASYKLIYTALPIAFIGFAFFPGLPSTPRRWFLKEEELELAKRRLPQREEPELTFKTVKRTLSKPMWWICVPAYM
jgi:hypothetical protein